MFVHFPIVLWLAAPLFELMAVWQGSDEMLRTCVAIAAAVAIAIATGLATEDSLLAGRAQRVAGMALNVDLSVTQPQKNSR